MRHLFYIFLFAVFLFFISCENDIKVINLVATKNLLLDSSRDVKTIYSDSSHIVMILEAKQLNRYGGEKPYSEMPRGVIVNFYDTLGRVKSKLTANYAISYDKEKIMEAKNNVVVVNEKKEQLNTEHLVWDQNKAMIFSDKFVKINTGKEILLGMGMESDERFDNWKIKHPTGSFNVKEE